MAFLYDSSGLELVMRVGTEAEAGKALTTGAQTDRSTWLQIHLEVDSTLIKQTGENAVLHFS